MKSKCLVVAGTLPEIELEIGVAGINFEILIRRSFNSFKSRDLPFLLPWKNRLIGGDGPVAEKQVPQDPRLHVEREVVPILQVVFEVLFLVSIDDGVDIVKIEGELSETVQKRADLGRTFAGGSWKMGIVLCALADLDLGVFENIGRVLPLKSHLVSYRRTQPFAETETVKILCYVFIDPAPVSLRAGLQSYYLCLFDFVRPCDHCGLVLQRDVEVPLGAVEVHPRDSNSEHEVLGSRGAEDGLGRVVIIIDADFGRDEVGLEGVNGHVCEHPDEKNNQKHRDDAPGERPITLSLLVAVEG